MAVRRFEPAIPFALTALICGPMIAAAVFTGAWRIPRNDDWDYARAALHLHATGQIQLSGWGQMSLVGQLLLAQPFLSVHASVGTLHALGVLSTFLLIAAAWGVARIYLGPIYSAVIAALLSVNPLIGWLATTFMTDLPAAALEMSSLLMAVIALQRRRRIDALYSRRLVLVSLLIAILASSIRETALAAPAAILFTLYWTSIQRQATRRPPDRFLLGTTLLVVGSLGVLFAWRRLQPGGLLLGGLLHVPPPLAPIQFLALIGLFALPLTLILPWRSLAERVARRPLLGSVGVTTVAATPLVIEALRGRIFPGNLFVPTGPAVLYGDRPAIPGGPVWGLLEALAVLGTALLTLAAALAGLRYARDRRANLRRLSPADALLLLTTAFSVLGLAVDVQATGGFDRYVIPLIALVPTLLARISLAARQGVEVDRSVPQAGMPPARALVPWPALSGMAVVASCALFGVVSYLLAATSDAYDAARWTAASSLLRQRHVTPETIDAGFEWIGWHSALPLPIHPPQPATFTRWEARFGATEVCWILSNVPRSEVRPQTMDFIAAVNVPIGLGEKAQAVASWTDAIGGRHTLYLFHLARCHS